MNRTAVIANAKAYAIQNESTRMGPRLAERRRRPIPYIAAPAAIGESTRLTTRASGVLRNGRGNTRRLARPNAPPTTSERTIASIHRPALDPGPPGPTG